MTSPPIQDPGSSLAVAVLGLGEAGSLIARDLIAAGATVRGYDPKAATGGVTVPDGVVAADSEAAAVAGSALVLSVNSAKEAVRAFEAAIPALRPGAIWADLNTASPGTKQQLAAIGERHGIPVTDIAMMAPVPGNGLKVSMLASGAAAGTVAAQLTRLGANVEVLDGQAGLAAARKLLRSVFYKGMAASIVEALDAARAAGLGEWLHEHIGEELAKADGATVDRIVAGTRQHAVRRGAEMAAAAEMLTELGVPPLMADASRALHERIAAGG
ncbi:MAG: 6-phosphogluconate dehydrogenase [Actinomycetia bacterium]|nr:6-phosphogluconate dehydrogenase [Actinomycetes bacterium]